MSPRGFHPRAARHGTNAPQALSTARASLAIPVMRISQMLAAGSPTISFEFFPPRDDAGFDNLFQTIDALRPLQPSYVSVTYGAGGSTRRKTIELVRRIKHEIGIESMAHLTCVGASRAEIDRSAGQAGGRGHRERAAAPRRSPAGPGPLRACCRWLPLRQRTGRIHPPAPAFLPRRRLLSGDPSGGLQSRFGSRQPQAQGRFRRGVPDHAAVLRQPRLPALPGPRLGDWHRRSHPGRDHAGSQPGANAAFREHVRSPHTVGPAEAARGCPGQSVGCPAGRHRPRDAPVPGVARGGGLRPPLLHAEPLDCHDRDLPQHPWTVACRVAGPPDLSLPGTPS